MSAATRPATHVEIRTAVGDVVLEHGADPHRVLAARGLRITRLVAAEAPTPGFLRLTVETQPCEPVPLPTDGTRRDPDVRDDELATAVPYRRVAAYALVRDADRVLLTQLSDQARTAPGQWTMPGGGLDEGEEPSAGVTREVHEETGQEITDLELVGVSTDHWIGRAPNGTLEDFHPIRLLYAAHCPAPTTPVVHDIGGTTSDAAWVPVADVLGGRLPLVRSWRTILPDLLR